MYFFSFGRNFLSILSWCSWNLNSLGKPGINIPTKLYKLCLSWHNCRKHHRLMRQVAFLLWIREKKMNWIISIENGDRTWLKYCWRKSSVEWLLLNSAILQLYHGERTSWFSMRWWWGLLCTRVFCWIFIVLGSLKQQSVDKHVAPLGHIILIPSQPVFALSP